MEYQAFEEKYLKMVDDSKLRAITFMYDHAYIGGKSVIVLELETGFWDWDYQSAVSQKRILVLSPFLFPPFRKEVTD